MSSVKSNKVFVDVPSEDVTFRKLDIALRDTTIKCVSGLTVGGVYSLLFKRKRWPLVLGFGVGLGMGIANLQHSLKQPLPKMYETTE